MTLGKSNGEDTGYITASFDDVTISYDRDDMVISEAGCYETAMTSYALNQLEVPIWQTGLSSVDDRYKNTGSALRITDTTLDLGMWNQDILYDCKNIRCINYMIFFFQGQY